MSWMFHGCVNLLRLYCSDTWNAEQSNDMFTACHLLMGSNETVYEDTKTTVEYAHAGSGGYFTPKDSKLAYAVYENNILTFYYDMMEESHDGYPVLLADSYTGEDTYEHAWRGNLDIKTVVFDNSFANCASVTSTAGWFAWLDNLSEIINLKNLNTDKVTNMKGMFQGCGSCLVMLDLSKFNTTKVTNMENMFEGCCSLQRIYCNNTWKTINSENMFRACDLLAGGDGTQYKEGNTSVEYAKPTEGGYFTPTLKAIDGNYWMTYFCSTHFIKADENTKVFVGELNESRGELMLHEIEDGVVPSGTGVVVMSSVEAPMFYKADEEGWKDDLKYNALRGSDNTIETSSVSSVDGTVYTLAVEKEPKELGFFKYKGEKLLAHKAYLAIPSSQDAIRMVFDDNGFTGIKDTQRDDAKKAERYFDLQGRPVANPTKGLYIVNGKKIVKK